MDLVWNIFTETLRRLAIVNPDHAGTPLVDDSLTEDQAFADADSGNDYAIFLTPAIPGSIPAKSGSSYVVYFRCD